MVMTWTILTRALDIFPDECPISDGHFNVCFIGFGMHFGFEKIKMYFIEQWEL